MTKRILVVIPTYNERDNIQRLIPQMLDQHPRVEVLIVDDGSPDGTGRLVEGLARTSPRVHLLQRNAKLGLGTAYIAGFQLGISLGYDLIIEMDADFSHAPGQIPRFLEAMQECDVAIGSRYVAGGATPDWPLRRRWLSRVANLYNRMVTGVPVSDATSGFRCFRREVLEQIELGRIRSKGYGFQLEMAFRVWRSGFRIQEIPITFTDRAAGRSKLDGSIVWEALWVLWKLRLLNLIGRL